MKQIICSALLYGATASVLASAPARELKPCGNDAPAMPCLIAGGPVQPEALPEGASAAIAGELLTISWRGPAASVRLVGEIQGLPPLPEVAPGLRQAVVRVPNAARLQMKLNFMATGSDGKMLPVQSVSIAGAEATPPATGGDAGRRELRIFNDGKRDRKVTVWLPPGFAAGRSYPIIYAADGGAYADGGVLGAAILQGSVPGFIVVGVEDCGTASGDPRCRGREYVDVPAKAGGAPEEFERMERLLIETVIPRIEQELGGAIPGARRAIVGASSGADWAAAMALRHPDLFSTAFVFSPAQGSYRKINTKPTAQFYFIAGVLERPNVRAAHCLAGAIHSAGGKATLQILPGGHSPVMWQTAFQQYARDWLVGAKAVAPEAPPLEDDCFRFPDGA